MFYRHAMTKSKSGGANSSFESGDSLPHVSPLKSNLKKQPSSDASESCDVTDGSTEFSSAVSKSEEEKKVHFNKFATVQMMQV